MKKKIIPAIAMLVVSAICVGLAFVANPIPHYQVKDYGTPVVMTINGDEIHANEYAAYFQANKSGMESQYAMFGLDTSTLWTDPSTADQMIQSLRDSTKQMLIQYHVIKQEFEKSNLKLTKEEITQIKTDKQNLLSQYNSKEEFENALVQQGLTEEMFDNSLVISKYVEKIQDYYFGKGGIYTASDEDLIQKFKEQYVQAKHILIAKKDMNTGEDLTGEALEEAKTKAKEALKRAQEGEDFDALINEYGEDPGMVNYPNGYIFKDGDMVPEFYNATLELKDNEISKVVESDYGYHIIMRMPLDAENNLDETDLAQTGTYRDLLNAEVTGKDFLSLLKEWINSAKSTMVDSEVEKITVDTAYDLAMTGSDLVENKTNNPENTESTENEKEQTSESTEDAAA